jgi:hypothetical protein
LKRPGGAGRKPLGFAGGLPWARKGLEGFRLFLGSAQKKTGAIAQPRKARFFTAAGRKKCAQIFHIKKNNFLKTSKQQKKNH